MEKEEKSYVRNLLDLKYANADMFYRVLSEMDIDIINNLCQVEEFSKICDSPVFWEKLWRQKVPSVFPFHEDKPEIMKERYLEYAILANMADFIQRRRSSTTREFRDLPGKSKEEIMRYLFRFQEENPIHEGYFSIGIIYNNINFCYFSVNYITFSDRIVNDLVKYKRGELVDRLFSLLPLKEQLRLVFHLRLEYIVKIPRKNGCSDDLVKTVLNSKNDPEISYQLADAIMEALKKNCQSLLDFLIPQVFLRGPTVKGQALHQMADFLRDGKYLDLFLKRLNEEQKAELMNKIEKYRKFRSYV